MLTAWFPYKLIFELVVASLAKMFFRKMVTGGRLAPETQERFTKVCFGPCSVEASSGRGPVCPGEVRPRMTATSGIGVAPIRASTSASSVNVWT